MGFEPSGIVVALLPTAAAGFPVTIEHALGARTIPAPPTRIVALSFEEDVLGQVGLTTVGHADNAYPPGTPYPRQEGVVDLAGSTALGSAAGIDLEQVAALQPDLVLVTGYYGIPDVYEGLSRIAPTTMLNVPWLLDQWRPGLERVAGS